MSAAPLEISGLANLRDLGGLRRRDGTTTPTGVFLRSEKLDLVTPAGWEQLRTYGVATVIDLRRPEERTGTVPDDIDLVPVDLDGDESEFWEPIEADGRWGTPLYYPMHLAVLPHRMRDVLDAVSAARPGAVLVHCAAGWDRTGFVSAVLLRALDVTPEAAAADYLTSFANAEATSALHGRPSHVEARLATLTRYGHTPESAFAEMYDELRLDDWFAAAGITATTRDAILTWRGSVHRSRA